MATHSSILAWRIPARRAWLESMIAYHCYTWYQLESGNHLKVSALSHLLAGAGFQLRGCWFGYLSSQVVFASLQPGGGF